MKKKILSLFMVLSLVLVSLVGCSSSSPKGDLEEFMKEVQTENLISKGFNEYEDEEMLSKELLESMDEIVSQATFDIGKAEVDGDKATVKLTIKNKDYGRAFKDGVNETVGKIFMKIMDLEDDSEEAVNEAAMKIFEESINEAIEKADREYVKELDVKMVKKDDKWQPDDDSKEDILDACTGGLIDAFLHIDEYME